MRKFGCFKINCEELQNINKDSDHLIQCYVGGSRLIFLIDSGCKVNIIKNTDWDILTKDKAVMWDIISEPTDILKPNASAEPLKVTKKFVTSVSLTNKK